MNALKKQRIKAVMKYTWPIYLVSALVVGIALYVIFGVTHKTPGYKRLTIFISGQVTNSKKLEKDVLEKYKDNELKYFTTISSSPSENIYDTKFNISGIGSADIMIVATPKLESITLSTFALDLSNEFINSYYSGLTLYEQDGINYGIKIDKEKVKEYMTLPDEDCYMLLNAKSENIGEYSSKQIKEHDNALSLVKEWGI